jgi:protein dithiol oxidoreductase (disulfide-forming)
MSVAKSFSVEGSCRRADQLVKQYRVDGTPTFIVNGRYRISSAALASENELIDLVQWLVAKETR